jgi:hypothetical protein
MYFQKLNQITSSINIEKFTLKKLVTEMDVWQQRRFRSMLLSRHKQLIQRSHVQMQKYIHVQRGSNL